MYSNYFGLKEASFSITPDPQYLFLSEQHREALAHLLYGAGESGGFVLLTGEVGTGKTTVCRAFLEQLPAGVDVALILNPAMTVPELLHTVCDELHIAVPERESTVKCLVDRLNAYLLNAHAEGRRAVLMIDEAQDLQPEVLEQVRLLTNLETTKHKLLQIFLVGQPELRTLLQREGLRQLNQRITARYHLRPFDAHETAEYVRHRLAVAGVERQLFTRAAMRLVHRISGGVPRLINILCDRALLGACVTRSPLVTKEIVNKAAQEVKDPGWRQQRSGLGRIAAVVAALVVAGSSGWVTRSWLAEPPYADRAAPYIPAPLARWLPPREAAPLAQASKAQDGEIAGSEDAAALPTRQGGVASVTQDGAATGTSSAIQGPTPRLALARLDLEGPAEDLVLSDMVMDRASAMRVLLRRWGIELKDLGQGDPCIRVRDYGLRCERDSGGWDRMRFFDRPALVRLVTEDLREVYLVIGALDAEAATLELTEGSRRVNLASLDQYWDGEYLMLWQPPPVGGVMIGPGSVGESVRWLRKLLSQVPDLDFEDTGSGTFDKTLGEAVRGFQAREGLETDGVAGPKTLVRLHSVVGMPEIPGLEPDS
ncbi:MAG: AAA family ATPase [Chromatiaceae bacterium]|nr:AAA family ATPase [Chromatiaceae bacterium]